jgi:hypothetical protein
MSMSRKDYVEAAKIVAAARGRYQKHYLELPLPLHAAHAVIDYFEMELASMFAQDNSRFDARRFAAACNAEVKDD